LKFGNTQYYHPIILTLNNKVKYLEMVLKEQ